MRGAALMSPFGTPRRFAVLPKFGNDRSEADMKTSWRTSEGDGVAHTVGAVTALLEREDYTRAAWYRYLYAPSRGRGRMTVTTGRRELLAALGGAALAWPLWPPDASAVFGPRASRSCRPLSPGN